jgi:hypothetical protein
VGYFLASKQDWGVGMKGLTTPAVIPKKIWKKAIKVMRWRERSRKGRGRRDFMSARAKIE